MNDTEAPAPLVHAPAGRAVRFIRRVLTGLVILIVLEAVLALSMLGVLSASHRKLTHETLPALVEAQRLVRLVRELENEARALVDRQETFTVESRLLRVRRLTDDLLDAVRQRESGTALTGGTRDNDFAAVLAAWTALLDRIDSLKRQQIASNDRWLTQNGELEQLSRQVDSTKLLDSGQRSAALAAVRLLVVANSTTDPAELTALRRRFDALTMSWRRAGGYLRRIADTGGEVLAARHERLRLDLHVQHFAQRLVLLDRLVEHLSDEAERLSQATQRQGEEGEQRMRSMIAILLAIVLASIGLAVTGSVLLDRRILSRLQALQLAMQDHVRRRPRAIDESGDDEIADMARSFQHFVDKVRRREERLEETIAHLNDARASLVEAEKLASLGRLVAGVAHELNTPIGTALTTASTLSETAAEIGATVARGDPLSKRTLDESLERIAKGATMIERNVCRAARLIESFKSIAVDQAHSERRCYDLAALLDQVAASVTPALRTAGLSLYVEIDELPAVDGYPGELSRALIQLFENSRVHAFAGRESGELRLRARCDSGERIVIELCDNGCGISANLRGRLFEPFFTTKMQQGPGLGLHIVHNVIRVLHGGDIELESAPGAGSCFRLILLRVAPQTVAQMPVPAA